MDSFHRTNYVRKSRDGCILNLTTASTFNTFGNVRMACYNSDALSLLLPLGFQLVNNKCLCFL
jgi:hypothetical protein